MSRPVRRTSPFRVARALWRYRGRIEAHGGRYQTEIATALRTALESQVAGRMALGGYRLAMRALVVGCVLLAVLAVVLAVLLWRVEHAAALVGLVPLAGAGVLGWWRLAWGAPLDWLAEHADPERRLPLPELPGALRQVARELRQIADVPGALAQELDDLAGVAEQDVRSATRSR